MPSEWLPGAQRITSSRRNPMAHNNPSRKLVLHTTESPSTWSAQDAAHYVISHALEYSATFNVHSGDLVQIYPVTWGARSLENGGIDGGIGCNRSGTICFQLVICGRAADGVMLTREAMKHKKFTAFLRWINDWGVPARDLTEHGRSLAQWHRSGVTCHANAPGNHHTDCVPLAPMIEVMKHHEQARHNRGARR